MAEAEEDTFLSDIHRNVYGTPSDNGTIMSQFVFCLPNGVKGCKDILHSESGITSSKITVAPQFDEDGDLLLPRLPPQDKTTESNIVLHIEHAMSTPLSDVGQQVWRGALLMADHILYNREQFRGSTVLELGAGVGIDSIVACLSGAKCVLCTDVGSKVLDICKRNIDRNILERELPGDIRIKELNWMKPFPSISSLYPYSWDCSDFKTLETVDFILAADPIYDDSITEAFFWCLVKCSLRIKRSVTIIITLEKRINFTLKDLAPASPAYDFFWQCLGMIYTTESGVKMRFEAQRIPLSNISKFTEYERVQEMEIWQLNPILINNSTSTTNH